MSDMPAPPPPPPPNFTPPPGYVAYGTPGAPGQQIQRIKSLTLALSILVGAVVLFQVLSVFTTLRLGKKVHELATGQITVAQFRTTYTTGATGFQALIIIPVAVLTMLWMFRMANNVQTIGYRDARWRPGWAIGGWFVPPLIVYAVPWLMFKELWRASDSTGYSAEWRTRPVAPIVTVWWVLYGLVPIISIFTAGSAFAAGATSSGDAALLSFAKHFDKYRGLNVVLAIAGVAAAATYLVLVRQLGERHMRATHER